MRPFRAGFLGAPTDDAVWWLADRIQNAHTLCIPFTGSGKSLSSMTHSGLVTESWDTQIISRAFVEGVFAKAEADSALDSNPRFTKGHMYEVRSFKGIDERSAGFIDWVGRNGTLFDKAAIATAVAKSTFRGRMTEWNSTFSAFWGKYLQARTHHGHYTNLPGKFVHHEADWYKTKPDKAYDVLYVDPPKIITSSDAYSKTFEPINRALGGEVSFDRWTWRDYIGKIRNVLDVQSSSILFLYTSDVRPDLVAIRRLLSDYGKITEESTFSHRNRFDYTLEVTR